MKWTFNNRTDLIHTRAQSNCTQGAVQWKEQSSRDYIALENVVYSDDRTKEGYVCKSTVGENELTGITNRNHKCTFVYTDLPGYSGLYRTFVIQPKSGFSATWVSYLIGDDIPEGAFIGGRLFTGTPLYVCRAPTNGVQYAGYYDPDTALAYIYSSSALYPTAVDLLTFSPSGPTTAGPTTDWPCPRYHVQVNSPHYEYIEHYGPNGMPTWAVITEKQKSKAVGQTAGEFSTPAKFHKAKYYSVYGDSNGVQNWGYLLKTKLPYQWEPFEAGSDIPYNALLGAHTIDNDPLYIVMAVNAGYSIGSYNSRTKSTKIQYYRIVRPTSVHILTLSQPRGCSAWSDAGYNTYSGPITAIRIQHGVTVTGIKCQFGAQWSAGFWLEDPAVNVTQTDLKANEYIKGVKIDMNETLDYIVLFTNLDTYGPFGNGSGGKNVSMFSRCGQIHHFSGYLRWDEQTNKTFSFAVHGESCT